MKGNDLDNKVMPRMVIVFEGALGYLPDDRKDYDRFVKQEKWHRAVDCFLLHPVYCAKVLDLGHRQNYNISVVTWLSSDAAIYIEDRLTENNLPVRGVFYSSPSQLAMDLPYNPDIIRVYDPDPAHQFTFGGRGVILTSPNQLGV